jgi:hypothetical protein
MVAKAREMGRRPASNWFAPAEIPKNRKGRIERKDGGVKRER